MAYVVTEACVDVKDNSCVSECPVDCIYEGDRQMYINPEECIDCGACEPACPVSAIVYEDDLEPSQEHLGERQRQVFLPLLPLHGARKHGPLRFDHPDVAALPSRAAVVE